MTKIKGVPDGWELVRIGFMEDKEWAIGGDGKPWQFNAGRKPRGTEFWPIIRRIEPHCTWQHGMFKDGWLYEDEDGCISWCKLQPCVIGKQWTSSGDFILWLNRMRNPPVFRSSLSWNERIQQVGPTFEATLRGDT